MTLYKHLVYVDFVSFIMQSWNCYLKDTWEFFPTLDLAKNNLWIGYRLHSPEKNKIEMLVFKHIRNRFDFSKTKDFMFQRLVSEHKQRPFSKCAIQCGTPWKFRAKNQDQWKYGMIFFSIAGNSTSFLIDPWNFKMFFL